MRGKDICFRKLNMHFSTEGLIAICMFIDFTFQSISPLSGALKLSTYK